MCISHQKPPLKFLRTLCIPTPCLSTSQLSDKDRSLHCSSEICSRDAELLPQSHSRALSPLWLGSAPPSPSPPRAASAAFNHSGKNPNSQTQELPKEHQTYQIQRLTPGWFGSHPEPHHPLPHQVMLCRSCGLSSELLPSRDLIFRDRATKPIPVSPLTHPLML